MIANNTFRSDFYYRLAGISHAIPALRDRREDIPASRVSARHCRLQLRLQLHYHPSNLPRTLIDT